MWVVFAQPTEPTGVDNLLATYGPFAATAALMLYILRLVWAAYKEKDAEVSRLNNVTVTEVVPLIVQSTHVLAEAAAAMKESKTLTGDTYKLVEQMEALRRSLDQVHDDLHRPARRPEAKR